MTSRYKKKELKRKSERKKTRKKIRKRINITLITIIILIATCLFIWGKFFEVNTITVNDIKITNSNIPDSFKNIKIVHFSDTLYTKEFNKQRLEKLIKKINSYKPDIVIFTGDLINKNYHITDKDINIITSNLSKIDSKLGKYASIGDNDYYNDNYNLIMQNSDFKILKNNYDTIYNKDNNPIVIYGLDSSIKGNPQIKELSNKQINNIPYKIIIMHEGDYITEFINDYNVNLILAGHSLNGQIKIPGFKPLYLPKGAKDYYDNHYKINDTDIYISNGLGSFKYDYRIFNTPSINVYRLNK